ncbi:MarR family winged helix-turn-helix transcriptional regulator [Terrisporobacter sp.]
MKELDYKILRYVGTLSRAINSAADIKYKKFNLQKGQYLFITRICENPGINLIDLSNMLKVDKTTTTKAVKKLIEIGYINKEQDENYRKGYKLTPTEKGLEIYEKIMEEEVKRLEISLQGFSEEQKKLVTDLVKKMSINIEDYWMEAKNK